LIVGGLVLVWGLAPYGFGWRTERIITALVQVAERVLHLPLSTTQYRRGWFGSTAETWLALPPGVITVLRPYVPAPWLPAAPGDGFTLRHQIQHGPFPLGALSNGFAALRPVQTVLTSGLVPGAPGRLSPLPPLLQITTTVFLGGAGQGHVVMPAFSTPRDDPSAPQFVWEGLQGEVTVDTHGHHSAGAFRAPGLVWSNNTTNVAFNALALQTDITTGRHQPIQSETQVRVDTLRVRPLESPQDAWAVTGTAIQATAALLRYMAQGTTTLRLQTVQIADMAYGPGTSSLTFSRLDLQALGQLWREIRGRWQDEPSLASLWTRLLLSGQLARLLVPLLQASPQLALSQLSLQTPNGEIRASMHVYVDARRLLPPGYMVQLLQTIEAEAAIEAPVAWVRTMALYQVRRAVRARNKLLRLLPDTALDAMAGRLIAQYVDDWLEQGYLVQDGAMYKSQVRYRHGQLWLQGRLVELP
jgi:uncharacterized protein YdgA (DUF945 family)